jgi:hypothetical protein
MGTRLDAADHIEALEKENERLWDALPPASRHLVAKP